LDALRDGQLLTEVASASSQTSFEELVRRHGALVYNECCRLLANSHDAEDAAQAVFLVLWKKANGLRTRPTVAQWLHRVAINVCRNAQRARIVRRTHERRAAELYGRRSGGQDASGELKDFLDEDLDRLPERYRLPLILFHLEGRSIEEIGALLSVNNSTIGTRLSRGREMLRARLARRGIAVGTAALWAAMGSDAGATALPSTFVATTTQSACLFAAGKVSATGALSARATALANGAIRMMAVAKYKLGAAAMVAAALIGAGTVAMIKDGPPSFVRSATILTGEPPSKDSAKRDAARVNSFADADASRAPLQDRKIVDGGMDLSAVVKAHSAALGAIHSLDASWEVYSQWHDDKNEWKGLNGRWSRKGLLERCQVELIVAKQFEDWFFDGMQIRCLMGWNPHEPQKLMPMSQQGVHCETFVASQLDRINPNWDPSREFLFTFYLSAEASKDNKALDRRRTLQELVSRSARIEIRVEPRDKQGRFIRLRIDHPGIGGDPPNGDYFVIVLDSSANYLARRVEDHILQFPISIPPGKIVRQHVVLEREVTQFRDFGHGALFPMVVHERVIQEATNAVLLKKRHVVTKILVNEPLPRDAVDFRFPNNAIVSNYSADMGKIEAQLWGPDNKPIKAIKSAKDLLSK